MAMQQQHQQQSPNHGNMYSTINRFGSTQKSPPPTTLNPTHRVLNSIDNDISTYGISNHEPYSVGRKASPAREKLND